MPLNTVPVASSGRRPRAIVQIGGMAVPGWVSWSVGNNSFFEADTFEVTYSASALPDANDVSWFATQSEIFVEIFAGFPADPANPQASELQSLIYGRVDTIGYDPIQQTLHLTGRDLTAAFIDARISATYNNQTASSVATALAGAHGLQSNVTATTDNIGTYYTRDQVSIASNQSEWELLGFLAREAGFVCYVSGQELYFGPDPTDASNPYVIQYSPGDDDQASPVANVIALEFEHTMTVAKGISVTVRSPNRATGKAVVQSYPTSPKAISAGKSSPFGATQQYYFTLPAGKSPTECAQYAEATYDTILSHEMKLTATMPGDDLLTILTPISVTGTGTAFDQIYYPKLVTRSMSFGEGYAMRVEAQNVNPNQSPAS